MHTFTILFNAHHLCLAVSSQLAGELLTCEHDPVYTFGLREKNLVIDEENLKTLGAEVFKVYMHVHAYIRSTAVETLCFDSLA